MGKLSTAAALSGWSQNRNVSRDERDRAAEQAFQIYESVADGLRELLEYCESRNPRDKDGISELGYYEAMYEGPAYGDVASRLRQILDGE